MAEVKQKPWLIFDLGGVLLDFVGINGFVELTGMSQRQAAEAYRDSVAIRALETGTLDAQAFADELIAELGLRVSTDQLLTAWSSWVIGAKPGVSTLLGALQPNYHLACLSNTNALHWARIIELGGLAEFFERTYLSFELGLHKPEPAIFEQVLADLGDHGRGALYFDDRRDIVDAAILAGLSSYQVDGPAAIQQVLDTLA